MNKDKIALIGYSGHAFVVCDILLSVRGQEILGYFDREEKIFNPYQLDYLGEEKVNYSKVENHAYFIAIGDNGIRKRVFNFLLEKTGKTATNAIHAKSSVSISASLGKGIMIGNGSIINACTTIGNGVICNTNSTIEHECVIGDFSHIAPGAVLCGNVHVGQNTFIGAGAVVKQGIKIGDNVIVGAGTVVIRDIPSNSKVVGNPQKNL